MAQRFEIEVAGRRETRGVARISRALRRPRERRNQAELAREVWLAQHESPRSRGRRVKDRWERLA